MGGKPAISAQARTWGHAVARLPESEIKAWAARVGDMRDWWRCRVRTKRMLCGEPVEYVATYRYVTGRAGRTTTARHHRCRSHADKFATKYNLTLPAPPDLLASQPDGGGA